MHFALSTGNRADNGTNGSRLAGPLDTMRLAGWRDALTLKISAKRAPNTALTSSLVLPFLLPSPAHPSSLLLFLFIHSNRSLSISFTSSLSPSIIYLFLFSHHTPSLFTSLPTHQPIRTSLHPCFRPYLPDLRLLCCVRPPTLHYDLPFPIYSLPRRPLAPPFPGPFRGPPSPHRIACQPVWWEVNGVHTHT